MLYAYDPTAVDPDGDPLQWFLDDAPVGMSVDPRSGALRWTPRTDQVGTWNVTLRVADAAGASATQTYTVAVRAVNQPPLILSAPVTEAFETYKYTYAVRAVDPERDPLTYSLDPSSPGGMTFDPGTGLIEWTPMQFTAGTYTVTVLVSDGQGGTAEQVYDLVVAATASDFPPAITSLPVDLATEGEPYRYQVVATDPEGAALTYTLSAPTATGLDFDSTGLVTWDWPLEGTHLVTIPAGNSAYQAFLVSTGC